jgi:uncharacterized protein YqeY
MSVKEELTAALKSAMKEKNTIKKNTVRMILSNIKNAEIDSGKELGDPEINGILQKQLKMRNDTLKDAVSINRQDIIQEANLEIEIIKSFLPESMDPEALKKIVSEIISEIGAESMRDMGKVMQAALPKVSGKASNAEISAVVRELLS